MDTAIDDHIEEFLSPGDGSPISDEHRRWMNDQIKATLEKKRRGEMEYASLQQVRREFGLDAP